MISSYSPGKKRATRSRVAAKLAVRASSRPNSRSTRGRATWVESSRSVAEWKLPTFSAREWRSAAEAALGRKRLVHVDEVELGEVEQVLERA